MRVKNNIQAKTIFSKQYELLLQVETVEKLIILPVEGMIMVMEIISVSL